MSLHEKFYSQIAVLASSSLASITAIVLFCSFPCTRAHPGPVLFFLFLCSGLSDVFSMTLLITAEEATSNGSAPSFLSIASEVVCFKNSSHESVHVEFKGYLFWAALFFMVSTSMWYLMMANDLVCSMLNPFLPFRSNAIIHHIYVWPTAGIWVILVNIISWIDDPCQYLRAEFILLIPSYFIFIFIIVSLYYAWRKSGRLEVRTHVSTQQMAKRIIPFLMVFGSVCIVATLVYIVRSSYEAEPGLLYTSLAVELAAAIETIFIFSFFCIDSGVLEPLKARVIRILGGKGRVSASSLSAPQGNNGYLPSRADSSNGNSSNSSDHGFPEAEVIDIDPGQKPPSVSELLRMDIIRYTANGILSGCRNAMKMEIQRSIGVKPQDIQLEDYIHVEKIDVPVQGIKYSVTLSFHDCAPLIFQDIRRDENITPEMYMKAFELDTMFSEHGSEGKSGNMFYFTSNGKYMVKTVPEDEYKTLVNMLPYYHKYLKANPDTLLCKYFGCHSISLPVGTRRMYFVVMQNLFLGNKIHQRFDLKGNTDRRQAVRSKEMIPTFHRAKNLRSIRRLMLDVDFLTLHRGLSLSISKTAKLEGQLYDDVTFLASRGIMDYSLLVGIRHHSSSRDQYMNLVENKQTGIMSTNKKWSYYIGVVDVLQTYNWKWALQRWFLGYVVCKDIHNISAVPPLEYAKRFASFISERLFQCTGEDCGGASQGSARKASNGSNSSRFETSDVIYSEPSLQSSSSTLYHSIQTPVREDSFFI